MAVSVLTVTTQIDAQYLAFRMILDESPHPIGTILRVYTTRPRPSPFREHHDDFTLGKQLVTFFQCSHNLFSAPPTLNRDTFSQVTGTTEKRIPIEVHALW